MVYKKVYFHQLHIFKGIFETDNKSASTMRKCYQTNSILDEKMQYILDNELNEYSCVQITEDNDGKSEVLEVINHDSKYVFARLGKMKDIHQFQLRNRRDFSPAPIDKSDEQEIEVFTYMLLDRKNYIISYLREQSAPSIQRLGSLITQVFRDEELFGEISSITVEDALPLLSKKDQIGTINYKVSIPPEGGKYFTQEFTGLSESEYESLTNQKSIDFDIKLVVNRNKDSFDGERSRFQKIIKKIADFASIVKVKAKNEGEYMQEYKIVDTPLERRQNFKFNQNAETIPDEIYKELKKIYIEVHTQKGQKSHQLD